MEAGCAGTGCVPIYNLMEDAATAEISRAQIWQWIKHPLGVLSDGRKVTAELYEAMLRDELDGHRSRLGEQSYAQSAFERAAELFSRITLDDGFVEFLTLPGYQLLD